MVNGKIDIHRLNTEELSGIISIYPWFALARKELCVRLAKIGACSERQFSETAMYLNSARILSGLVRKSDPARYADSDVRALVEKYIEGSKEQTEDTDATRIFVVGGDYFSLERYKNVSKESDNIFSCFAKDIADAPATGAVPDSNDEFDIYTETLAQIYMEQGYPDMAKEIYSKLILRYPEKSVYFATLIEKINNI